MGLDIALMRLLGLEGALDDDIGLVEALLRHRHGRIRVRLAMLDGFVRLGLDALGEHGSCAAPAAVCFIASSTSVTCGSIS